MKSNWFTFILVGCLAVVMAACSTAPTQPEKKQSPPAAPLASVHSQVEPDSTSPVQGTQEAGTATIQPTGPSVPSGMEAQVETARHDLAQMLKIPVESVTVSAVIGQEFSPQAFQCGKTTERIAKDPPPESISGFSILLMVKGKRYEYHASEKTVVFCRGDN
jgi:hypothetical protein